MAGKRGGVRATAATVEEWGRIQWSESIPGSACAFLAGSAPRFPGPALKVGYNPPQFEREKEA